MSNKIVVDNRTDSADALREHAASILKGGIGMVPVLGTLLNEVLFEARSRLRQHRRLPGRLTSMSQQGPIVIGETPIEWRVLVPLSFRLLGLASRLAVDSLSESKPDPSLPAGAVVLSIAALEAFINEEADLTMDEARAPAIEKALREREFPDRWEAFVRATWNVGFQRGQRPFQAFDRLHELRNAIVHYRPHFLVPGSLPDTRRGRLLENLRHDYALREGTEVMPWTARYLSPGCAAWACRTARDMVRAHFSVIGQAQRWDDRYAQMWPLPPELEGP